MEANVIGDAIQRSSFGGYPTFVAAELAVHRGSPVELARPQERAATEQESRK
jgi:hypothetical protein